MNIKNPCNCPSRTKDLNVKNYNNFLFEVLKEANKSNQNKAVVKHNGNITFVAKVVAEAAGLEIYAIVNTGSTSTTQVTIIKSPL